MKTGISMAAAGWQRQSPTLRESKKPKVRQMRHQTQYLFHLLWNGSTKITVITQNPESISVSNKLFSPELLVRATA